MHAQTAERVRRIESRVLERTASLSQLKDQISGNSDKYIKDVLQLTANWLDDVEVLYLGILKKDRMLPRTLAEESWLLDQTEFFLEKVVVPQLKAIQDMVTKFGPNVQSIG